MRTVRMGFVLVGSTVCVGFLFVATPARSAAAEQTKYFCGESIELDATRIQCSADNVKDFTLLTLFPKLSHLSLAHSTVLRALHQLPGLSSLRALDLSSTPIADFAGIEKMPQLQELRADWTWVHNLDPLAGLKQLRVLSLAHTPVEDLTPLSRLAKLESLDLCDTRVTKLGPLATLDKLRELRLCQTPADAQALLAQRPGLKVIKAQAAASDKSERRLVMTEAGTELLNSFNERLGTQKRPAVWFASPQYGGAWHVRRRVGPLLEGYHVRAGALRDVPMHQIAESWLVPSAAPAAPASQQMCQSQGLCNVELRAGNSLPAGALWTGVIAASDMKFQQAWRLCRRGEAVEVERPGLDWLAPAAGDLERLGRLSMALDQIHITADQQPAVPPSCANAKDAAARKTVLSGRAPAPIMGIFLLRKEDAGAVDRLSDAKARFEQAQKLAVKHWIYPDRWCDDAVHQAMLLLGEPTPAMTPAEARQRYWGTIVARHNAMYREYDKAGCERALDRMLTAKQLAAKHGYRYYQFGY